MECVRGRLAYRLSVRILPHWTKHFRFPSVRTSESPKHTIATVVRFPVPEVMKIDVIKSSCDRRRATYHKSDLLSERQMICFRSKKPYHRAANCRAPAPITAHVVSTNNEGAAPVACSKQRSEPVRTGRLTGYNGGPSVLVADLPSSPPVLRARLDATTTSDD